MKLKDVVCVVTGGANGIGEATVRLFAEEGADIAILDVDSTRAEAVVREARVNTGRGILAIYTDVSSKKDVERAFSFIYDEFGRIDVLVNDAGVWRGSLLAEMSEEDWDTVFTVNVKGVFLCSQAAARVMVKQRSGSIVNIASVAGKGSGAESWGAYSTSKAAVIMLTRVFASELKPYGVRVNALCPGATETSMLKAIIAKQGGDYHHAAKPEAVAEAVLLLASNEAQGVTGEDFDGPPWGSIDQIRRRIRELSRVE